MEKRGDKQLNQGQSGTQVKKNSAAVQVRRQGRSSHFTQQSLNLEEVGSAYHLL